MVFKHYRQLVRESEAKAWFSILPPKRADNIVPLQLQTLIRIGAREFKELCRRHFGDEGHGEITWENIRISQRTVGNRSGCNKTIQLRFQRLHPAIT